MRSSIAQGLNNYSNDSCASSFKSNDSSSTIMAQTQCTGFRFDSPKMFQRKQSFKLFQRKTKNQQQKQPKICFISPEKSDIFKKYSFCKQNLTNLNSSYLTSNSNQFSCFQSNKSISGIKRLQIDLNDSRQVLNQIKNSYGEQDFKTPRNIRNDFKNNNLNSLKKISSSKIKAQGYLSKSHLKTEFDKDFDSLIEINDMISPINSRSAIKTQSSANQKYNPNYFKSQNRNSKPNYTTIKLNQNQENYKQNKNLPKYGQNIYSQRLDQKDSVIMQNQQLTLKVKQLQFKIDQISRKYLNLQNQKLQLQDSSKLFLQQIRNLQGKIQRSNGKTQTDSIKINQLQQKLRQLTSDLDNQSQQLDQLLTFKQSHQHSLSKQFQHNEHFKQLFFQLNKEYKYLSVEKDMLKKQLQQSKQYQQRIDKLEIINRKLTAKTKFLQKQIQQLQKQNIQRFKKYTNKNNQPNSSIRTFRKSQNQINRENKPGKRYLYQQTLNKNRLRQNQNKSFIKDQIVQMEETQSMLSKDSQSQLSFELSPEKCTQRKQSIPKSSFFRRRSTFD